MKIVKFLFHFFGCCLGLEKTKKVWPRRDLNTQPFDLESNALPLRHGVFWYWSKEHSIYSETSILSFSKSMNYHRKCFWDLSKNKFFLMYKIAQHHFFSKRRKQYPSTKVYLFFWFFYLESYLVLSLIIEMPYNSAIL